jgi:NhaA family Na+:H+ antiporter
MVGPPRGLFATIMHSIRPARSSRSLSRSLSQTFKEFSESSKAGGIVLIACTLLSLAIANSALGPAYLGFWHQYVAGLSIEHWVNDALMAIFFLLIGLELERELVNGELSDLRNAMLPMLAAAGGIAVPALIHFGLNGGSATQAGVGIPMATDIAFALGVLALLGSRVPASLKIFLTALAVMDDLGAIVVIALFYSTDLSFLYLLGALAVFAGLLAMNRVLRVMALLPYLAGGALMWFLMLKSGVHATIAGVLLAFAIPFSPKEDDAHSPSHQLEHILHKPVTFLILPLFALANTGIVIGTGWATELLGANSMGIMLGLVVGKPVGIFLFTCAAVTLGLCRLPLDLAWRHVLGAGLLGGIGSTMSIFITNLAFTGAPETINASKMAILAASLVAGIAGFTWLKLWGGPLATDHDTETLDFEAPDGPRRIRPRSFAARCAHDRAARWSTRPRPRCRRRRPTRLRSSRCGSGRSSPWPACGRPKSDKRAARQWRRRAPRRPFHCHAAPARRRRCRRSSRVPAGPGRRCGRAPTSSCRHTVRRRPSPAHRI